MEMPVENAFKTEQGGGREQSKTGRVNNLDE